jgi:hypothetical protein
MSEPTLPGMQPPIEVERRQNRRPVAEHTHKQPRWPIITLSMALILLAGVVVVLAFAVVDLAQFRDQQARAIQQSVRSTVCDVLDVLQAGGRLDLLREQYDCGPGMLPPPPTD